MNDKTKPDAQAPQDENQIVAERRAKLAALRAQGQAFPNDFRRSDLAADLHARHGGEDIGYIFGGYANGAYRGQQFSFLDTWRSYSIGNLLQQEQLRWLCQEEAERYDMGPMMEYKAHWTEQQSRMDSWLVRPRALRQRT